MKTIISIARQEWRYWARTRLGIIIVFAGLALTIASTLLTATEMSAAANHREHLQSAAEARFYEQPDRHPHRMVHYGHYVFRAPSPLSIVDPGLDAFTGNSIFLEGHRQNTAMFAERKTSAGLSDFGTLTPAFVLQKIAPLLLLLIGYNVVSRERESRTLDLLIAQGIKPGRILAGKGLALAAVAGLMLVPLVLAAAVGVGRGEELGVAGVFLGGYALYLSIWCSLIVFISAVTRAASTSLGLLLLSWIFTGLLIPPLSSTVAASILDSPGKIESDLAVMAAKRKVGDGHNAADPAFTTLKNNLLAQYQVETIEQLPMNFRGIVAAQAETELTSILNRFAERRMQHELGQAKIARTFGWLSPVLSVREFSMNIAGVDLETHHRFLREAEQVRFDFVQSLNKLHAEKLAYDDDINRSRDPESEKRTRIDSDNWAVLREFRFMVDPPLERITRAAIPFGKLLAWFLVTLGLCAKFARQAL